MRGEGEKKKREGRERRREERGGEKEKREGRERRRRERGGRRRREGFSLLKARKKATASYIL